MPSSTVVPRVLARHIHRADLVQHDVTVKPEVLPKDVPLQGSVQVLYSDGGVVTTADVARLLEGRVASLTELRFSVAMDGVPGVRWKARDQHDRLVSGWLLLHAGVRGEEAVMSWAEIVIDQRGEGHDRQAHMHGGGREDRLDEVARRTRGLIRDLREGRLPLPAMVGALVAIVDVAEADHDDVQREAEIPKLAWRYDRRAGQDAEGADAGLLARQLEMIAQLGRDLLVSMKNEPTFSHGQILRGIARIVSEAERE